MPQRPRKGQQPLMQAELGDALTSGRPARFAIQGHFDPPGHQHAGHHRCHAGRVIGVPRWFCPGTSDLRMCGPGVHPHSWKCLVLEVDSVWFVLQAEGFSGPLRSGL